MTIKHTNNRSAGKSLFVIQMFESNKTVLAEKKTKVIASKHITSYINFK